MFYFFKRGNETVQCEVRSESDGPGYEIEGKDGARYVDKILKGTKPLDIPVEQPMRFELVINLQTAEKLGVKIPRSVVDLADKIID